eukprot:gb/GECH01012298.1/.p1 GENE.gb/GECH01012298.1/~~gb/GECH01012298.1/.p1  ORF type:complete len:328 (+),score=43.76 gb/GECH01012298.1/:1-984(+)
MLSFPKLLPLENNFTIFTLCAVGIFGFYLSQGVTVEYLFTKFDDFRFGIFLTLIQFITYALLSGIVRISSTSEKRTRKPPLRGFLLVGIFSVTTMALTNTSLRFVNYPTQVLFKSCKLLPVMIGGMFITGRKYNWKQYTSALMLVGGLVCLSYANSTSSLLFDPRGVLCLLGALTADAFVGNLQEKVLKEANASPLELIFFAHSVGVIYLTVVCIISGEAYPAVKFCFENPSALGLLVLYSSLGFVGVMFFMAMMKRFGAFAAVTTTSCRKVVTLLLSFVVFPKPVTPMFGLAVGLVFSGVAVNIFSKHSDTDQAQRAKQSKKDNMV